MSFYLSFRQAGLPRELAKYNLADEMSFHRHFSLDRQSNATLYSNGTIHLKVDLSVSRSDHGDMCDLIINLHGGVS
jgi:hypothetical protein